jgi:hypothetical protein
MVKYSALIGRAHFGRGEEKRGWKVAGKKIQSMKNVFFCV